jgi:hypothetical protein
MARLRGRSGLGHAAAANASRANQDPFDAAAVRRAHFLQIRLPSALGLVVGVAYVVADGGAFAANVTGSHLIAPLRWRWSKLFDSDYPNPDRSVRIMNSARVESSKVSAWAQKLKSKIEAQD